MDKHPLGYQPSEPVYDPGGRDNVLMQSRHWWDKWGWRHRICAMEADYVLNVLGHLENMATQYALMHALSQRDVDGKVPLKTEEWLEEIEARDWITTTSVYRALEGPALER